MIRLKESIQVQKPLAHVFRYVSEFSHIQNWDPGVQSAVKSDTEKTGVGSTYRLVLRFGPFRPEMTYQIVKYEPYSCVVLKGKADSFTAIDKITFNRSGGGTWIEYEADIQFNGMQRHLEWALAPVLKWQGSQSIRRLKQTLHNKPDSFPDRSWFQSGSSIMHFLMDHMVLPGMVLFSRYGYEWEARSWTETKDTLYGKKVVLTGGTAGIGKAAAFSLASYKACLTIIARDRNKAEKIVNEIITSTGNPNIDYYLADLSKMNDIRQVAKKIQTQKKCIDVLINNAGALFNHRQTTSEGLEKTFATDLLGVFYLTMHLKEALAASKASRIINVSSGGMYTQKLDVHDLENRFDPYNGAKAYARAKRGVVILTKIWAEQFKQLGITVNAMHPGWVDTPGIEKSLPGFHQLVNRIMRTPEQGADTIVWLAADRQAVLSTGLFWLDRRPHETMVFPGTGTSESERALLWQKLCDMLPQGTNTPAGIGPLTG